MATPTQSRGTPTWPLATPTGHTYPIPGHIHPATSTVPPVTSMPMGSVGPTALGCRPSGSGELPSPEPGVSPHCISFSRHLQWRLHLASVDSIPNSRQLSLAPPPLGYQSPLIQHMMNPALCCPETWPSPVSPTSGSHPRGSSPQRHPHSEVITQGFVSRALESVHSAPSTLVLRNPERVLSGPHPQSSFLKAPPPPPPIPGSLSVHREDTGNF